MAKELYLYSPIYDTVVQELMSALEDHMGEDVVLRENTPGGSVFASYGLFTKLKEHGSVHVKVDGAAFSGGGFVPLYAKSAECLDVARFMLHRADMYVSDATDQAFLDSVNKDLKAQMKLRLDAKKFKEITGHTIEDLFNPATRLDIYLTGKEAKEVGLVNKVTKLTPQMEKEMAAMHHKFFDIAAMAETDPSKSTNSNTNKYATMTAAEFKAANPTAYNEILALGVEQEKDRVGSCLVYIGIDPAGVKAAIESGKPLTETQRSEFALKAAAHTTLTNVTAENAPVVTTTAPADSVKTEKEKTISAFEEKAKAALGLVK